MQYTRLVESHRTLSIANVMFESIFFELIGGLDDDEVAA